MKFDLMSDVHLDFIESTNQFKLSYFFPEVKSDVLLIAGDICTDILHKKIVYDFFEECSKLYKDVYFVLGNHDIWSSDENPESFETIYKKIGKRFSRLKNIHFLENESVKIGDVTLLGCSLWTSYKNGSRHAIYSAEKKMNDFRWSREIDEDGEIGKIRSSTLMKKNEESFKFIKEYVENHKDEKIVILTHHCPSFYSAMGKCFFDGSIPYSYVNEYDDWIKENENISVWLHGHVHIPQSYEIGKTRVISNPCGYIGKYYERFFSGEELVDWKIKSIDV